MKLKIFADMLWVFCRVIVHLSALAPVMWLASNIVGSVHYGSIIYLVLVIVYSTLAYAQLKTSIFQSSGDMVEIANIFYKGKSEHSISDLQSVSTARSKITFEARTGMVSLNLMGMRKAHKNRAIEEILSALDGAGVTLS